MEVVWIVISVAVPVLLAIVLITFATGFAPRWVLSWEAYCVRLCKKRKRWSWTMIEPNLFLGGLPRFPFHIEELRGRGVGAVLTLNETWELGLSQACLQDCDVVARQLPTPDFFAPRSRDIVEAVTFIQKHIRQGTSVYVHCNGGKGRSAVCVICYLILEHGWSPDEAFAFVRTKRKIADMKAWGGVHKQWRAICNFARNLKKAHQDMSEAALGPSSARYVPKLGPGKVVPLQAGPEEGQDDIVDQGLQS